MKGTEEFKETIKNVLEERAFNDVLFAEHYNRESKNIDDCITYILNTVKNSGCNGFTDDEIYNMAYHYYDEEVQIGENINCNIIVNHQVELTEEEKKEARALAIKKVTDEAYLKFTKKNSKENLNTQSQQIELF